MDGLFEGHCPLCYCYTVLKEHDTTLLNKHILYCYTDDKINISSIKQIYSKVVLRLFRGRFHYSTLFLTLDGILHHLFSINFVALLNGILQQVMLHFYTSFRILFQESTASIQYFLKLTLSRSKTVSLEEFYSKACCTFLKECPTVFKECITICNGTLQKK